jgi:hypothetical protein
VAIALATMCLACVYLALIVSSFFAGEEETTRQETVVYDAVTERPLEGALITLYREGITTEPIAVSKTNEYGVATFNLSEDVIGPPYAFQWYQQVSADGYSTETSLARGLFLGYKDCFALSRE